MIDILGKNMQALRERYPDLAVRIEKWQISEKYRVFKSNKVNNILLCDQEKFYYAYGNEIPDTINQIKSFPLSGGRLFICLGLGLGYELFAFTETQRNNRLPGFLIVFEKEFDIFYLALKYTDLSPFLKNKNIEWIVGTPEEDLFTTIYNSLSMHHLLLSKSVKVFYHATSMQWNGGYYKQVVSIFKKATISKLTNFGNDPGDSLDGIENMIAGASYIARSPGIIASRDKFPNQPAVVVATGPSLNKNKHLLRGLEDRAIIIAADASLKILLEMDIKPHIVCALERVPEVENHFKGLTPDDLADIFLAPAGLVIPEIYKYFPERCFVVGRSMAQFYWLPFDIGVIDTGSSVGNMCFNVAAYMGCNPIVLIGQDLAYGADGTSHASGTFYGTKQFQDADGLTIPGYFGGEVPTNRTWHLFWQQYQLAVSQYKGTCINATEGGAHIPGTEQMPFARAIELCFTGEYHFRKQLMELCKLEPQQVQFRIEALKEKISVTLNDLDEITKICHQVINRLTPHLEIFAGNSTKQMKLRKLEKLFEFCVQKKDWLFNTDNPSKYLLMHVIQSVVISKEIAIQSIDEQVNDEAKRLIRKLLLTYEEINIIAQLNQRLMDILHFDIL